MTNAQIQLCGRLIVRLDGERVEDALPGTQGRQLFGFLALNFDRHLSRAQLAEAVWGERLPSAPESIHNADSAVSQGDWRRAWVHSHVAVNVARRRFLAGLEAPWIDAERRALEEVQLRGLETLAAAGLGLRGAELDLAERSARSLTALAPYRESGHRLLMEVLAARGNVAESLLVYESLRKRLRDELGVSPGDEVQALHAELLGRGSA
jgi:DNA-binding SARP family transcriptional activator